MGQTDNNGFDIRDDGTIVRNPSSSRISEMKRRLSTGDNGKKGKSDKGGKGKWGWLALLVVAGVIIGGIIINNQDNSDSYDYYGEALPPLCCPDCGSDDVTNDGSDYQQYECNDCGYIWGESDE